jgi:hypothetical protein
METQYIISESELTNLLEMAAKLFCLESGGVDNWEGYDFSMEDYHNMGNLTTQDLAVSYTIYKGN